ncbi:MAG: squalene/phytoene synthase family protein [Candidatus Nealsonbacteria bacterium]|nr:squalene/phytoene synthase family protein [Candidatus Nealsonbacteria bacterium]
MTFSTETIDVSYDLCRQTARQSGSNFYTCFFGLPRPKRRAMDALYAFMRYTDDLADDPQPVEDRRVALSNWRAALAHALDSRLDTIGQLPGCDLLPAVADTIERFGVPPDYLHAVIDGVEMDLTTNRYETFAELETYCEKVASAVGMACIHVWGFRGREALEPARKCGIAMQLTNVLRDLKEDARRDRVYLPLADLRHCDYTVDDLLAGVADERFEKLMDFEIGRAEWYYRKGAELMDWLEPGGRRIFGMMMSTYRALLRKILHRPQAVFARRVRLSRPKKLQIAARWTLLPTRTAALP